MAYIFIALSILVHIYIFCMESLLWGRPRTNKAFGMSPEMAESNKLFAFNQGFYNLFLAIAGLNGLGLLLGGFGDAGLALIAYSTLSMVGAALVLIYSQRKFIVPALIQGLPPLLGLLILLGEYL